MNQDKPSEILKNQNQVDQWFTQFIDDLKVDHLLLSTNTASPDKVKLYKALIGGDVEEVLTQARQAGSMILIKNIVVDYLNELSEIHRKPIKLALGISDSRILVWAEIEDNDEEMEDALLLTEAKVNNKYHSKGIFISSMILEKSDNVPIPLHYQNIL